ncbi:MAG: hypothetical protein KJ736_08740 [Candidatus Omnitrophica bacterium]|nr:hypothetical protein [Candidatus Omnitrophota bacterium]
MLLYKRQKFIQFRFLVLSIVGAFVFTTIVPLSFAQQILAVPAIGDMITPSQIYSPTVVAGITIHPENPLQFDFIIDSGDDNFEGEKFEKESKKLINYFLATLTVPEDEMWVNLSPYESNRIIADGLSATEMGRDMLIQDYILKQFTASLMYPEEALGEAFWKKVYEKTQAKLGTTDIPANTFNKVWIVPDKASVYINKNNVFVGSSHLKVMLEEDYLALDANIDSSKHGLGEMKKDDIDVISADAKEVIREIIIPEIEREVNEGKNFANLRQIYNSMLLATWYKRNLHNGLLGKIYMDQNKVKGIDLDDRDFKEKIYKQYIEAFKVGVYDYIKEDYDPATQEIIERKYFSGGLTDFDEITTKVDNSILSSASFKGDITNVTVDLGFHRMPVRFDRSGVETIGEVVDLIVKEFNIEVLTNVYNIARSKEFLEGENPQELLDVLENLMNDDLLGADIVKEIFRRDMQTSFVFAYNINRTGIERFEKFADIVGIEPIRQSIKDRGETGRYSVGLADLNLIVKNQENLDALLNKISSLVENKYIDPQEVKKGFSNGAFLFVSEIIDMDVEYIGRISQQSPAVWSALKDILIKETFLFPDVLEGFTKREWIFNSELIQGLLSRDRGQIFNAADNNRQKSRQMLRTLQSKETVDADELMAIGIHSLVILLSTLREAGIDYFSPDEMAVIVLKIVALSKFSALTNNYFEFSLDEVKGVKNLSGAFVHEIWHLVMNPIVKSGSFESLDIKAIHEFGADLAIHLFYELNDEMSRVKEYQEIAKYYDCFLIKDAGKEFETEHIKGRAFLASMDRSVNSYLPLMKSFMFYLNKRKSRSNLEEFEELFNIFDGELESKFADSSMLGEKVVELKAEAEKILSSDEIDIDALRKKVTALKDSPLVESAFIFDRSAFLDSVGEKKDDKGEYIRTKNSSLYQTRTSIMKEQGIEDQRIAGFIAIAIENVVQHVDNGIALVVVERKDQYIKIEVVDNGLGAIDGKTGQRAKIERIIKSKEQVGKNGSMGLGMYMIPRVDEGLTLIKQPGEWGLIAKKRSMPGISSENKEIYGPAEKNKGFKVVRYLPKEYAQMPDEQFSAYLELMREISLSEKNSVDIEKMIDAKLDGLSDAAMLAGNVEMIKALAENILNVKNVDVGKLKAVAGMLEREPSIKMAFVFNRDKFLASIEEKKDNKGNYITGGKNYAGYLSMIFEGLNELKFPRVTQVISIALENVIQHVRGGIAFVVVEQEKNFVKVTVSDNGNGFRESGSNVQVSIKRVLNLGGSLSPNGNRGQGMSLITQHVNGLTLIKQPNQWGMVLADIGEGQTLSSDEAYGRAENYGGLKVIKYLPISEEPVEGFNDAILQVMLESDGEEFDSFDLESMLDEELNKLQDLVLPVEGYPEHIISIEEMGSDSAILSNPGGIDLNSQGLDIKVYGDDGNFSWGENIDLFTINEDLENIQPSSVEGLTPVIINITPIMNINMLLGKTEAETTAGSLSMR